MHLLVSCQTRARGRDYISLCLDLERSASPQPATAFYQPPRGPNYATRWRTKARKHAARSEPGCTRPARAMTTDMLKFLTQKLKSQSLNEGRGNQDVDDEERDSGTESDENLDDEYPYDTRSSPTEGTELNNNNNNNNLPDRSSHVGRSNEALETGGMKTHEISEHNFDTVSCTSDYERHSLDFDRHSSEDELVTINKENVAEKRKWSQVQRSGYCDSAGSSDDEVKDFLFNPQPVLLSSDPPKGVQKVLSQVPLPRMVLARMAPITVSSVSPRKRHRYQVTSENVCDSDSGSLTQRPCLDFEKMQQVEAFV